MSSHSDKVIPAEGFVSPSKGRISPAERALAEAGEEYYSLRQVSEICGVHIETVRRVTRTSRVNAPSYVIRQGQNHIWLCSEADLIEIGTHFNALPQVNSHLVSKYKGVVPARLASIIKEST